MGAVRVPININNVLVPFSFNRIIRQASGGEKKGQMRRKTEGNKGRTKSREARESRQSRERGRVSRQFRATNFLSLRPRRGDFPRKRQAKKLNGGAKASEG